MTHVLLRCPSCTKLYQVETEQIASFEPHFKCVSCNTDFTFDLSETSDEIKTRKIIFETPAPPVRGPVAPAPQTRIDFLWSRVMDDFSNEKSHQDYFDFCKSRNKLDQAKEKYLKLVEIQGRDEISQQVLEKIRFTQEALLAPVEEKQEVSAKKSTWLLILKIAASSLAFSMIILGTLSRGNRNMIGAGFILLLLTITVSIFPQVDRTAKR